MYTCTYVMNAVNAESLPYVSVAYTHTLIERKALGLKHISNLYRWNVELT